MDATNLVIHIFALVSFVVLIWLMLRSIGAQRFLKRCIQASRSEAKGFIVMKPLNFLDDLGRSMGYPVNLSASMGTQKFVKCCPKPWMEFIIHQGIESVSVAESSAKIQVTIKSIAKKQADTDWTKILTESVDGAFTVDVIWLGEQKEYE